MGPDEGSQRADEPDALDLDPLRDPDAMVSVPCQTNRLSFNQIQAIRDLVHVAPVDGKGEHARQVRRLDCSSLTIRVI